MSTDEEKENFQKSISESGELPPHTEKRTPLANETTDSSPKKKVIVRSRVHSKYIGVFWCGGSGKWHANFGIGNKKISFGRHMTERGAALAYDVNMRKLVKRLDRYNFPDSSELVASAKSDQMLVRFQEDEKVPEDGQFFGPKVLLDKKALREKDDED